MADVLDPAQVCLVLPDGDEEEREASLDLGSGSLVLRQTAAGGSAATFKLASLGTVSARGPSVQLRTPGHPGRMLLELRFRSADLAQKWSKALRLGSSMPHAAAPSPRPSPSNAAASGPSLADPVAAAAEQTTATLRLLLEQQEEQVSLLQAIHQRKAEQVMNMQQRLAAALEKLNEGQVAYAAQQRLLEKQAGDIVALQARLQAKAQAKAQAKSMAANIARSACETAAAEATAGRQRARFASSRPRPTPPVLQAEDTGEAEVFDMSTPATDGQVAQAPGEVPAPIENEAEVRQSLRELHTVLQVLGLGGSLAGQESDASP